MYSTLRQIIEKDSLCGSRVLAGEGGLSREVRYFGVLDAPDCINLVRAGEFVVSTGFVFLKGTVSLAEMIRALHLKGGSGIGIKLHRYIDEIPPEASAYADEHKFPVLALPADLSWHDISSIIMSGLPVESSAVDRGLRERDGFLHSLITSDAASAARMLSSAAKYGVSLPKSCRIAVGKIEFPDNPGADAAASGSIIRQHLSSFEKWHRLLIGMYGGDGIFLIIPSAKDAGNVKSQSKDCDAVGFLCEYLSLNFPKCGFSFGVGNRCESLTELSLSLAEASDALSMGRFLKRSRPVTYYDELGVLKLLGGLAETPQTDRYIVCYIKPLSDFDKNNRSDLLPTLTNYIECGLSIKKCSEMMFLHTNTIRYRLEKIEDICGISLSNIKELLALYLALVLYEIRPEG